MQHNPCPVRAKAMLPVLPIKTGTVLTVPVAVLTDDDVLHWRDVTVVEFFDHKGAFTFDFNLHGRCFSTTDTVFTIVITVRCRHRIDE